MISNGNVFGRRRPCCPSQALQIGRFVIYNQNWSSYLVQITLVDPSAYLAFHSQTLIWTGPFPPILRLPTV
jgi:hypothetical protein